MICVLIHDRPNGAETWHCRGGGFGGSQVEGGEERGVCPILQMSVLLVDFTLVFRQLSI